MEPGPIEAVQVGDEWVKLEDLRADGARSHRSTVASTSVSVVNPISGLMEPGPIEARAVAPTRHAWHGISGLMEPGPIEA